MTEKQFNKLIQYVKQMADQFNELERTVIALKRRIETLELHDQVVQHTSNQTYSVVDDE